MTSGAWVSLLPPGGPGALRLACLPHAGSGAGPYRAWRRILPPEVDLALVNLPGREARLPQAPFTDLRALVDALLPHLPREKPYVLFGHSMGALVAYEAARRLERDGGRAPLHLFVSGARAPHEPRRPLPIEGSDDALDAEMLRLGGTPGEVLANRDLMALLRPAFRADLMACAAYRPDADATPLACGITACGGDQDPDVPTESLRAWSARTRGPFTTRVFQGGHFYLHRESAAAFLDALGADLRKLLAQA